MDNKAGPSQGEGIRKITTGAGGIENPTGRRRVDDEFLWLAFLLGSRGYAINAKYVTRVVILREIVPFANPSDHCPGIIWDRDGMIRLLDLRSFFGQGNFLSALKDENRKKFPMIVVIWLDGDRYGLIVDKIISMEHFYDLAGLASEQDYAPEGCACVKCTLLEYPAVVISPDSFREVEFEKPDTKIDWDGRYDIRLKISDP